MEDKSQYQPPQTVYSSELYESAFQNSPEKIRAPFQFSKDLEAILDSSRDTAEALEQMNGREVTYEPKYLPFPITFIRSARPHNVILKKNLDAERYASVRLKSLNGEMVDEGPARFCIHYGANVQTQYSTPDVGHWYLEEMIDGKPGTGLVTHFMTHKDYILEINHDGQSMPVSLERLSSIVRVFHEYTLTALKEVYPIDLERAEAILGTEAEIDAVEFTDNVSLLVPPVHREPDDWLNDNRAA